MRWRAPNRRLAMFGRKEAQSSPSTNKRRHFRRWWYDEGLSFGEGRAGGDLDCDSEELQRQSYDYL